MHELSIALSIVKQLEKHRRQNRIKKIKIINLKIGELRAVVPEMLKTAFKHASAKTICKGARLHIRVMRVKFICNSCGKVIKSKDPGLFRCKECGCIDARMKCGNEFLIHSVEYI